MSNGIIPDTLESSDAQQPNGTNASLPVGFKLWFYIVNQTKSPIDVPFIFPAAGTQMTTSGGTIPPNGSKKITCQLVESEPTIGLNGKINIQHNTMAFKISTYPTSFSIDHLVSPYTQEVKTIINPDSQANTIAVYVTISMS